MLQITLTTQQILYICDFIGIEFTQPEPEELSTEITIMDNMEIEENGKTYTGLGVYQTEYPEEGAMALEDDNG
ncbi:putative phage protein [Xenorhabdus poinarii G6]|uniref:Putative phage protein n=1 Tax=Xenorhabdus poinarii G6 TaxID=1354304 RepID=A0A068R143_9GAMM|nr:hypothetical protein [Xenorhabdus poinarii]CDG21027.1 putative phage protein [Xenorhabdus poinarii G6]